jgi:ABC-type Fe3+ transport system permease subunit
MLVKKNIPIVYILGKSWREINVITLCAMLMAVWHEHDRFTRIIIPLAVPDISGTSILLVPSFRSNAK